MLSGSAPHIQGSAQEGTGLGECEERKLGPPNVSRRRFGIEVVDVDLGVRGVDASMWPIAVIRSAPQTKWHQAVM